MKQNGGPTCPCRTPGIIKTWESNLTLCGVHAREWLYSEEKETAKIAIETDDQELLEKVVTTFIQRIQKKPPLITRIRFAINALLGGQL